jgi:hypothetical protein
VNVAEPRVLESVVHEVQVFRAGAVVTRVATLPAAPWPEEVALDGLPLALDDESVRVAVVSGDGGRAGGPLPRPGDVRVTLVVPEPGSALEPPSETERREAAAAVAALRARIGWIDEALALQDRIELALAPGEPGKAPPPAPAAAWQGILDWDERARRKHSEERARLARELVEAQERVSRLARRDAEARAWLDARGDGVSKRVLVRLRPGKGSSPQEGPLSLRVEYRVPGARWVPSYVLRLARDGRSAVLAVRAHVVQATGEAWERVRLRFSTADLAGESELPELSSLRIGRRQPEPARKAWRDPPTGTEALYEGLDRALAALGPPPPPHGGALLPPPPPPPMPPHLAFARSGPAPGSDPFGGAGMALDELGLDDDEGAAGGPADPFEASPEAESRLVRGGPPPASAAMPMASMAQPMMDLGASKKPAAPGGMLHRAASRAAPPSNRAGGGGAPRPRPEPAPETPGPLLPDSGLLRYSGLALARWDERRNLRGRLRPLTWQDQLAALAPAQLQAVRRRLDEALRRAEAATSVGLPLGTTDVASSCGAFDFRYDAEGLVDVPCDGTLHSVPLFGRSAPVRTVLVVVPRESTQAVRVATLKNPLEAPLLAGPVEVYLEEEFLAGSSVRTVPLGGELTVGLGVEEGLKVARNVFSDEEAQGMLGGRTALKHRVEVELASRLATPVTVEVRERVPVTAEGEKEIEVLDEKATPAWEPWGKAEPNPVRGGRCWRLALEPGKTTTLHAAYTVRIDAKNELNGGNRRG